MRRHCLYFFVLLLMLFAFPFEVAAQSARTRLKLVFPFGEESGLNRVCLPEYVTEDGCCKDDPSLIYSYNGRKGCCQPPLTIVPYNADDVCCTSCGINTTRYGQTDAFPCGAGCCQNTSQIVPFNGKQSCCSFCNDIRLNQTDTDICGKCCQAGETITYYSASPYCCPSCNGPRTNQTDAMPCGQCCDTATHQLVYYSWTASSCCPNPPVGEIRYNQTDTNICGNFCSDTKYVNAFGSSTCCPSACASRMGQTNTNICGQCCSDIFSYSFPGIFNSTGGLTSTVSLTGCCVNDAYTQSLPNNLGTICCLPADHAYAYSSPYSYYENGMVGQRGVSVGCCSYSPITLPNGMGTACCSPDRPYFYMASYAMPDYYSNGQLKWNSSTTIGCCSYSPKSFIYSDMGTFCCSPTHTPYVFTYNKHSFRISYEHVTSGCCPYSVQQLSYSLGGYCCSPTEKAVAYASPFFQGEQETARYWSFSCCKSNVEIISIPGDIGDFCCNMDTSKPYAFLAGTHYNTVGSIYRKEWGYGCCHSLSSVYSISNGEGTYCCGKSAIPYVTERTKRFHPDGVTLSEEGMKYSCCSSNYITSFPNGRQSCCQYGGAAFSWSSIETSFQARSFSDRWYFQCCGNNQSKITFPGRDISMCCSSGRTPYFSINGTSYKESSFYAWQLDAACCSGSIYTKPYGELCCPSGQTPYELKLISSSVSNGENVLDGRLSIGCCSSPKSLSGGLGTFCCPNNNDFHFHQQKITGTGSLFGSYVLSCCTNSMVPQSLPYGLGTYCCPSGLDPLTNITNSFTSESSISYRTYSFNCCWSGTYAAPLPLSYGTTCCSSGRDAHAYPIQTNFSPDYNHLHFSKGCCLSGQTSKSLYGNLGTYCCSNDAYVYENFTNGNTRAGTKFYSVGCCATGETLRVLQHNMGTYCCSPGTEPYAIEDITSYASNGDVLAVSRSYGCCSSLQPLPNNWGNYCCSTGSTAYGYISVARYSSNGQALNSLNKLYSCCPAGTSPMSLVSNLGTYCCSPGKSPVTNFSSSAFSVDIGVGRYLYYYDRYTQVTCQ